MLSDLFLHPPSARGSILSMKMKPRDDERAESRFERSQIEDEVSLYSSGKEEDESAARSAARRGRRRKREALLEKMKQRLANKSPMIQGKETITNPELIGAVIRFKPEHADDGFAVLFSRGQVGVVGEDTYAVGPEHIMLLKKASVPYQIVAT